MLIRALPLAGNGQFHPIRIALRARAPMAWATIGFAMLSLMSAASHPLTAISLAGIGGGILLTRRYGASSVRQFGVLGMVIVLCSARLMAGALGAFAGAAHVSVFGPIFGYSGSFSLEMAIFLGAFATAALLRQGIGRWGSAFLVAGLYGVFQMGLSVAFGVREGSAAIEPLTLLAMACGSVAMLLTYLHKPLVRIAFLIGDIGSQTRVMAATIVALPLGAVFLSDRFSTSGGVTAFEVGVLSAVICSMLVILLSSSARHEGSVAKRRRAEREIAMRSRTDALTGALNKFGMSEVVEGAWLDFKTKGSQFGMILLDLEYFRRLDATFGHDDGEAVLGRVAQTVQGQLRGLDALGRWDKDEFMVILKIKDYTNIALVADRLRGALASADSPFCAGLTMEPARMDIALGISAFKEVDESAAMAITRADMALHNAKTTKAQMIADLEEDAPFDLPAEADAEPTKDDTAAAA